MVCDYLIPYIPRENLVDRLRPAIPGGRHSGLGLGLGTPGMAAPRNGGPKSVDQYAYKATGSTTCAIINITDTVGRMLENSRYVRCLLLDFSKAFDTVDHLQ